MIIQLGRPYIDKKNNSIDQKSNLTVGFIILAGGKTVLIRVSVSLIGSITYFR